MALAVKTTPESITRNPHHQLVLSSAVGALYVFFSFALVFSILPTLWGAMQEALGINPFLADSLLILVTLPVIVGLLALGKKLEGPHPQPGTRAGSWIGAFCLLLVLLITLGAGNNWFAGQFEPAVGLVLTLIVGVGLLVLLGLVYSKPGFGQWLARLEEAGWFHAIPFKPSQGLRVRRGTVIGLLVLGLCGIWTLISHHLLRSGSHWQLDVPFSKELFGGTLMVPIMYHLSATLPIVLGVALLWFSWRVVNWPAFADFLIATEAEMNKVSWTTRKRLWQDTVVVLVTVFLMTLFLFIVDILWIKILSNPVVDVLKIDPHEERARQREQSQW
jgi:preprotein translocase SecE subunit